MLLLTVTVALALRLAEMPYAYSWRGVAICATAHATVHRFPHKGCFELTLQLLHCIVSRRDCGQSRRIPFAAPSRPPRPTYV